MVLSGPLALFPFLRRFAGDKSGAAAVEFALVFPFLLLIYLGSVETTRFVMAKQKAEEASATVADLVTRSREVDASGLDKLMGLASDIMLPFPSGPLLIRISAIEPQTDKPNHPKVVWYRSTRVSSQHNGQSQETNALPMPTATDLAKIVNFKDGQNTFLIVVEVFYRYQPLTTKVLDLPLNMYQPSILNPRESDTITCNDCDTK